MNDKVRINDIEYIPVPNEIHLFGRTYVLDDCSDENRIVFLTAFLDERMKGVPRKERFGLAGKFGSMVADEYERIHGKRRARGRRVRALRGDDQGHRTHSANRGRTDSRRNQGGGSMSYKARIFTREELRKAFERVTDVYELSAQLPLETDIDNAVSLMYDHYGEETEVEE